MKKGPLKAKPQKKSSSSSSDSSSSEDEAPKKQPPKPAAAKKAGKPASKPGTYCPDIGHSEEGLQAWEISAQDPRRSQ